jgi:HlyD family secretion protein/epimerase transport system membrane fusion protein
MTLQIAQSKAVSEVYLPGESGLTADQLVLRHAIHLPALFGYLIISLFIIVGIGWATVAPLARGAVATGVISPDGSRRTVQHLEGGIIKEFKVREGDYVKAGDPLLVLQDTQASAVYDALQERAQTLEAALARLDAEQNGAPSIAFPEKLVRDATPKIQGIMRSQEELFEKRRASIAAQKQVLDDRAEQCIEQIKALQAQIRSADTQMQLIAEEVQDKSSLLKKGLLRKPELLLLERTRASINGDKGQYLASIAETRQKMEELEAQRVSIDADFSAEVAKDLEDARSEYGDVSERLFASADVLERTVVTAPVSGYVANLKFKSVGGVVGSGQPILDVVPTEEQLLIDARVPPNDIDVVAIGMNAVVHLTAYSNRGLPRVNGIVRDVSADSVTDSVTNQTYYIARVEIPKEELAALDKSIKLVPGMPAEVLIVAEEKTVLEYVMEPFLAAFRRGFREASL